MTERIQEMARQAGAQHRLNLGVEEFCFEHSELKKFAELIVRECIAECWYDATPKQISDNIKMKFGVEE